MHEEEALEGGSIPDSTAVMAKPMVELLGEMIKDIDNLVEDKTLTATDSAIA